MKAYHFMTQLEERFAQDIEVQRRKVGRIGRELKPNLTDEDLLQPHDVPELERSSLFNFEDGVLAGLLQAQTAVRMLTASQES